MKTFLRKVRMALTPRSFLLKSKLSGGVVVLGQNRKGSGGRGVYLSRDGTEPQLEHLERLLGSLGSDPVFVDVGASTGICFQGRPPFSRARDGLGYRADSGHDRHAVLQRARLRTRQYTAENFCAGARTEPRLLWMNSNRPNLFSLVKRDHDAECISTLSVSIDELLKGENLDGLDAKHVTVPGGLVV
jgi:hypothetical protein